MRLVVTGPTGAGKTTLIRSICQDVVDTEKRPTDEVAQQKRRTTVALDFGDFKLEPNLIIHLYGTPGQVRFSFMWEMLIQKARGYILLVAANRPQQFLEARRILQFMNEQVAIPMIIGVTHIDCVDAWNRRQLALALGYLNPQHCPPFVPLNATQKADTRKAMTILVQHVRRDERHQRTK
ncbi:MAG: ATP/GTP-binding protein [Cyanophyceae cyanobacterium]